MEIGTKIKQLRESKKISQNQLADKLGIGQTTLCAIESGDTKKVDFLLMQKICNEFQVDLSYFIEDKQVNNIKKNIGTIAYSVNNINNFPENLIEQVTKLVEDNKNKDLKISNLEKIISKNKEQ